MNKNPQLGISLVEIMVALVISLFLLGGIIQVYLSNKASYGFSESISRIQDNGRFAMDIMSQDLRQANFFGCTILDPADTSNLANNLNPAGAGYQAALYDFITEDAIEGTENDGLNGSDSITIRGSKPSQANVQQPFNNTLSDQIFISAPNNFAANDIVMLSNCTGADIFQVDSVGAGADATQQTLVHTTAVNSPGNVNLDVCGGGSLHCLSQSYNASSSVFELQTVTYTVAVTAADASGDPAIWRSVNGTNQELVDGVQQLQILYGVDSDADQIPNQYFAADAVADSTQVVSIRIMMLLRSDDFITESPQSYTFNGTTVTPVDRRLRQVFTTTIALRNRIGS